MSVATKSYVSSYANNQHTDEMAQRPRSPTQNHIQSQPRMSTPHPPQESNLKRPSPLEDDGEHRDKRQKMELDSDQMDLELSLSPINHERQSHAILPNARNRVSAPERSRQDQIQNGTQPFPKTAASVSSGGKTDADTHFLLCKTIVRRSRPDPRQHLLATHGLSGLLQSVARTDPFTGDKINKLRKSYEGQIKMFGLPGRNRAEKADREEDEPGPLRTLASATDARWIAEQGKDKIDISTDFRARLKAAMQLQPGKVRNNAEWEDILGHEKPRINLPQQPANQGLRANGPSVAPPRPTSGVAGDKRSTRGKKRSYGDDSFVGYGEGYSDMDDEGEYGDEYSKRKRKKDLFSPPSR